MSKYTTEVRYICEQLSGLKESTDDYKTVIENARTKVFDFDFPIYKESYRSVLETKILKHYYTREIGLETVGLWKLHLDRKLNEIMPYYNQLYENADFKFNPFHDVDVTVEKDIGRTHTDNTDRDLTRSTDSTSVTTGTNSTDGTGTSHTDTGEWNMYSDTPQGSIVRIDVENNNYLTNATHDTIDTDGSTTSSVDGEYADNNETDVDETVAENVDQSGTSTEDYLEHIFGKRGGMTYSKMWLEYREALINIDLMVINELADLFMNLW